MNKIKEAAPVPIGAGAVFVFVSGTSQFRNAFIRFLPILPNEP